MIIANKEHTKIAGLNIDIIFEFNSIIGALYESNPEIILGAIAAWSDILDEKMGSMDELKLATVLEMSEDYVKLHTKGEDND